MARYYRDLETGELLTEDQFNSVWKKQGINAMPTPSGGGGVSATPKNYSFETPEQIDALPVSNLTKSTISGYTNLKDLTPTDSAKVSSELYQVKYNPKEYVNRKLAALGELYTKVPEGFKGMLQGRIPLSGQFNDVAAEFDSARELLTREVARLNDVGVLSDQDVASYRKAMPARSDRNYDVVLGKLRGIGVSTGGGIVGNAAQSKPGSPERIAQYQAEQQKYTAEANKSMERRFMEALPKATWDVLSEIPKNAVQVAASVGAAPVEIVRQGYGLATNKPMPTLDFTVPFTGGKRTLQSEGFERIKKVQDKSSRGEQLTMGDYASALSPFAEVPLKVGETVGLARGAGAVNNRLGVLGVARQQRQTQKGLQVALAETKPVLSAKEQTKAYAAGRGRLSGFSRKVDVAPTNRDMDVAEAAQGLIKKGDAAGNISRLDKAVAESANKVRTGLERSQAIWNKNELKSTISQLDRGITVKSDATLNRTADNLQRAVLELAEKQDKKTIGILNLRQEFDRLINQEFPNLYDKDMTPMRLYVRKLRAALNDFAEAKIPNGQLPDGSFIKDELRRQHLLMTAIDNIAEKMPRVGTGALSRFSKKHPVVSNIGKAVGYTALTAPAAAVGGYFGAKALNQ